eukprot:2629744-Amphidinium_carterae.4
MVPIGVVGKPVVGSRRCSTYAPTSQACENPSMNVAGTLPHLCHVILLKDGWMDCRSIVERRCVVCEVVVLEV